MIRIGTLCLLLWLPLAAWGDDRNRAVYTSRAAVDEDFWLQGEYRGYQRAVPSSRSSEPVGLQVIALGNGEFSAAKYYGGLPGERWFGGQRYFLKGQRSGDLLQLEGDQYDIVIHQGQGVILTKQGREAGVLERVERTSPTLGAPPPPGAIVLFDGQGTNRFKNPKVTPEGYLQMGTETLDAYSDFRLHGEFLLPFMPEKRGQARANSGFYLQGRYEVQVLDSFGLEGIENECGSLYRTQRPLINMCFPPLQWQTYDIDFSPAQFDEAGNKIRNMRISVWHNGVPIHRNLEIPNKTGAGIAEGPRPLVTKLQDHGDPVVYRNIWLIDRSQPDPVGDAWLKLPVKAPPVPIRFGP
jgi:hypothetical protein